MKKIDGTPKTVRELFTGVKYTIHYYQREYQWKRKQIEELVEDLTSEFYDNYSEEDELTDVRNYGHYFLGSIILTEEDNAIIDGQQRLTSLALVLFYLYHNLEDIEDKSEVLNLLYSKKAGIKSYNINVSEREACLDAIKSGVEYELNGQPESVQNIWLRWQDVNELMTDKLKEKALPFFKDWLIDYVDFIRIEARTEQDAHKIFVSMNDRGLSLTPTEMLKGYLLSEISDDEDRQKANSIWKQRILQLKSLGKEEESDCIKNWLRAQYAESIRERRKGAKPEDFDLIGTEFHKWIRENKKKVGLNKPSDFSPFVREEFVKFSEIYIRLFKYTREFHKEYEYVFYNANRNFTLQSQLIFASIEPSDSTEVVNKKIKLVSCFLDLYLMRRVFNFKTVDYSAMTYTIFLLTKKIRRKNLDQLRSILLKEVQDLEFQLDGIDHYVLNGWTKRYMLHILSRITTYIENGSGIDSHFEDYVSREIKNPYDIEHIWADHFERHLDEFKTEEEFQRVRNKFGALLILPRDKNRSYNDNTYEEKLPMYYGENLLTRSLNSNCYKNNPQFLKFIQNNGLAFRPMSEFKHNEIIERQALYKAIAFKIWDTRRLIEI